MGILMGGPQDVNGLLPVCNGDRLALDVGRERSTSGLRQVIPICAIGARCEIREDGLAGDCGGCLHCFFLADVSLADSRPVCGRL